jgi:hypothetical protein
MDKKQAKSLSPLINNKEALDALVAYAEIRMDSCRTYLETAQTWEAVKELQGAVKELRRFMTLRDEVLKKAE